MKILTSLNRRFTPDKITSLHFLQIGAILSDIERNCFTSYIILLHFFTTLH